MSRGRHSVHLCTQGELSTEGWNKDEDSTRVPRPHGPVSKLRQVRRREVGQDQRVQVAGSPRDPLAWRLELVMGFVIIAIRSAVKLLTYKIIFTLHMISRQSCKTGRVNITQARPKRRIKTHTHSNKSLRVRTCHVAAGTSVK